MPSPQLVTTQSRPSALAKSFVVSVLPVPAGPAGAPPRYMDKAYDEDNVLTELAAMGL